MSLPHWALAFHNLLRLDRPMDCFGNAESYVWRWISMYSIALKNDSLIDKKLFWECGKMSMENVEIFSWGSRSLSTESSPPPFQRLQANQIVPLTCICLVFFIPLLHICLVFFTQYFSRQRLVTDYYFKYFNKKHNLKIFLSISYHGLLFWLGTPLNWVRIILLQDEVFI